MILVEFDADAEPLVPLGSEDAIADERRKSSRGSNPVWRFMFSVGVVTNL